MDIYLLDKNFDTIFIIDQYESLIWTDRFKAPGDFELYIPIIDSELNYFKLDYYISIPSLSVNDFMVIEKLTYTNSEEQGRRLQIFGRSLQSLIERRIVWKQTSFNGIGIDAIVSRLIVDNIISPADTTRTIQNFLYETQIYNFPINQIPSEIKLTVQYTGDNILDAVMAICEEYSIGFQIKALFNVGSNAWQIRFRLYGGADRSYNQNNNPYVVFSQSFDNLLSNNYMIQKDTLRTITLVLGEGEGTARKRVEVPSPAGALIDLDRRELYVDARDLSSNIDGGTMTDDQYIATMKQRGLEKLAENIILEETSGEINPYRMYIYGKDFFLGDIVQIKDQYGQTYRAMVMEYIRSYSATGHIVYPTFKIIED